jgi:hypothetical protein
MKYSGRETDPVESIKSIKNPQYGGLTDNFRTDKQYLASQSTDQRGGTMFKSKEKLTPTMFKSGYYRLLCLRVEIYLTT